MSNYAFVFPKMGNWKNGKFWLELFHFNHLMPRLKQFSSQHNDTKCFVCFRCENNSPWIRIILLLLHFASFHDFVLQYILKMQLVWRSRQLQLMCVCLPCAGVRAFSACDACERVEIERIKEKKTVKCKMKWNNEVKWNIIACHVYYFCRSIRNTHICDLCVSMFGSTL